jgi:hypothetical protein
MTIREILKKKLLVARIVAFGFWLLFAASFFLPHGSKYAPLAFIPFVGFGASVLYVIFFVTCPKCGARLGQVMSSTGKTNFCPGCGTSLDSRV